MERHKKYIQRVIEFNDSRLMSASIDSTVIVWDTKTYCSLEMVYFYLPCILIDGNYAFYHYDRKSIDIIKIYN